MKTILTVKELDRLVKFVNAMNIAMATYKVDVDADDAGLFLTLDGMRTSLYLSLDTTLNEYDVMAVTA